MPKFEVEFYETASGEQPARAFLLSLDTKMRAKVSMIISILQDNGYELREPYSKHLTDGIFELRAQVGQMFPECCTSSLSVIKSSLQTDLSRKQQRLL